MDYNLATVRDNVRNRLDDEDYEQEYLDRAINYTQWKITNKHRLKFMEKTELLSVNTGSIDAPLPADHRETLQLVVVTPASIRSDITDNYKDYADFVRDFTVPANNPPLMPYWWSEYGGKFMFSAPMDKDYQLLLNYTRKSPELVLDTDVPDIPEEFQELLELGAYMRIAKREDDYEVKSQEQLDYNDILNDLLQAYGRNKKPGGLRNMRVSRRMT